MWNGNGEKEKCQTKIFLSPLLFFPIRKADIVEVINDAFIT